MTSRKTDLHTLAGPYALNALPPADRVRFERHLAACEPCAQEVRGLRETAARLAAAAATAPALRLRERVLAEVARTRQLPPAPRRATAAGHRWPAWLGGRAGIARTARPGGRAGIARTARPGGPGGVGRAARSRPPAAALSAVFLIAALAFGSMALVSQHRLSQAEAREHMMAAVLTARDAKMMTARVAGGGTATIVVSATMRALAFSSAGLPALPATKSYELWVMGPSGDHSAAMLPAPQHGMTSPVMATGIRSGDKVVLTVEPAGGVTRPTSVPILLVALSP